MSSNRHQPDRDRYGAVSQAFHRWITVVPRCLVAADLRAPGGAETHEWLFQHPGSYSETLSLGQSSVLVTLRPLLTDARPAAGAAKFRWVGLGSEDD